MTRGNRSPGRQLLRRSFAELPNTQYSITKQLILRLALPRIILLLFTIVFIFVGGFVLSMVEQSVNQDPSKTLKNQIEQATDKLAHDFWQLGMDKTKTPEDADPLLDEYQETIYRLYKTHPKTDYAEIMRERETTNGESDVGKWAFFAATTLTLLGYGMNAPTSTISRIYVMAYTSIGIPLMLITLADLAKFCTEATSWMCLEYFKMKFRLQRQIRHWKERRKRKSLRRKESVFLGEVRIAGGDEEVAEFLWMHLENAQIVEIPFFLVYGGLLIYLSLSAVFFHHLEGWSYPDSMYFTIISVLTIGFGDVAPKSPENQMISMVVIFIGLVLTSTCMDVIGSYYMDRVHFFGRKMRRTDPLEWLKEVQQRRIRRMKQEAMRKLFETISALNFMSLTPSRIAEIQTIAGHETSMHLAERLAEEAEPPPPNAPTSLLCVNASASSVTLQWKAPLLVDGRKFWYTLTYGPKGRARRRSADVQMIDFINTTAYEVTGLNSFTLYEFVLATSTKYGHSSAVKTHEYTEPCTVPQNLLQEAVSSETATISWLPPVKNKGHPQQYTLYFAQEPAPEFRYWSKYRLGSRTKFTLTDLMPETIYSVCVSANHNSGLATVSKTLRITTKQHWFGDD